MGKIAQYKALIQEILESLKDNGLYDTADIIERKLKEIES